VGPIYEWKIYSGYVSAWELEFVHGFTRVNGMFFLPVKVSGADKNYRGIINTA